MKPYYQADGITIIEGEALEILPSIEACNLVVADPPFTFGLASTANEGKAGSWADLMNSAWWYAEWLKECRRVTSIRQGAAWVFNSWRCFPILARAASHIQWPIDSLLVWDKDWIGPGGMQGLRPSYELVALYAHDGFALANRGLRDIWRHPWSANKPSGHPAEKPVSLLAKLIRESGGGLVVDPFMGSGSTLVAAKQCGVPAIGIELEERWCAVAASRLSQMVLPLPDPEPEPEQQAMLTLEV